MPNHMSMMRATVYSSDDVREEVSLWNDVTTARNAVYRSCDAGAILLGDCYS